MYGAETWTLIKEIVYRLRVAQRPMKRAMVGINFVAGQLPAGAG